MLPALLTTLLFATNAVFARRAAMVLGSTLANLWRLALAAILLGVWALLFGRGLGAAFGWFFLSGLAGFGLGGLAMFHALPRAGSNLSMLIVQCGSAVVALTLEWAWLGAHVTPAQLASVAVILTGVGIGLAPHGLPDVPKRSLVIGAALAALGAIGQGAGAVLSRRAFAAVREIGTAVDPATAAYERALGGLLFAAVAYACVRVMAHASRSVRPESTHPATGARPTRAWPWVLANTLAGPVLGVTCFQWALSMAKAGIVQSIVATAPLITAPVAWRFGERVPRLRYFAGALLAVAGTVGLFVSR
jgi:drug/metabolite transporter (DMT)-like permease